MERVWNSPRTSKSSLSSNLSSLTNECTWVPVSYTKVITEGRGLQSSIFVLRVKEERRESTSVVSILPLTSCCHRQERSTPPRLCVGLHPLFWGTPSSPQPFKRWISPFIPLTLSAAILCPYQETQPSTFQTLAPRHPQVWMPPPPSLNPWHLCALRNPEPLVTCISIICRSFSERPESILLFLAQRGEHASLQQLVLHRRASVSHPPPHPELGCVSVPALPLHLFSGRGPARAVKSL